MQQTTKAAEGTSDFDTRMLVSLRRRPYFREATDEEIDASYEAYLAGDIAHLCDVWREVAEPTRAKFPPFVAFAYGFAGLAPRLINGIAFLMSLRSVLGAGERFRAGLSDSLRESLHRDYPWLENRHTHIPAGSAPNFDFPEVFAEFLEARSLEQGQVRWQLAVAINEVQQSAYSLYAADLFRLPELRRHAARERELAINYFGHSAPVCSRQLWAQTIYVLDALNAAVFEFICAKRPFTFIWGGIWGAVTRRNEWHAFIQNLDVPQVLVPIPRLPEHA